jgi:hypothetical protein
MHHVPPSFNKHTTVALLNQKMPSNYRNTTKLLTFMTQYVGTKSTASKINCNIAADGIFTWSTYSICEIYVWVFSIAINSYFSSINN